MQDYIGLDYPDSPESMRDDKAERPEVFADTLSLPLKSGSADTVLLTQVLEHVPDPDRTIKEVARILKEGGTLIVTVPMLYPIHSPPYDFFRYTKYGIEELLTKNGLSVETIDPAGGGVSAIVLLTNVFMMHKLLNLSKCKLTLLPALLLAPVILSVAAILNIIGYVIQPLDIDRKFTLNYSVIAKR